MPVDQKLVRCGDCNLILEEDSGITSEDRQPCPACGSLKRSYHLTIHDSFTIHEKIGRKGHHEEGRKPYIEQVNGDDLHRKSGKWMNLERIIDQDNDIYHEVVTNPKTGEVIHECKESLSKHIGHGAARHKDINK